MKTKRTSTVNSTTKRNAMKSYLSISLFLITSVLYGQSSDKNYVNSKSVRVSGITTQAQLDALTTNQKAESVSYFDGLGRPIQSVQVTGSPGEFDVVTPVVYDAFGRQVINYLPYISTEANGDFKDNALTTQNAFYDTHYGGTSGDYAFSETRLENSPLSRVLEQGSPGADWQIGQNTGSITYATNNSTDAVKNWTHDGLQASAQSLYSANELTKTTTTDEEGNQTVEFVNKTGQTVLKKSLVTGSTWAETYYIYDDYGLLRSVLPPEANNLANAHYADLTSDGFSIIDGNHDVTTGEANDKLAFTFSTTISIKDGITLTDGSHIKAIEVLTPEFLADWAFQYEYDGRNRMISKQVPGADPVYLVYDDYDRLVLTQDANQRINNEWLFTKYDRLNRPIITGIEVIAGTVASIRSNVASSTHHEDWTGSGTTQYSNSSFPATDGNTEFLTVSYYDDYTYQANWGNPALSYDPGPSTQNTFVKGQVTGIMTFADDGTASGIWIRTSNYYDDRQRLIQSQSTNHLGGKDIVTNYYDFIGQLTETEMTHDDGSTTTEITRTFEYDHAGRLLETFHQIGNNTADKKLITSNSYSPLGELIEKNLHSEDNGTTFEQSVDYDYNIRGWLRGINNAALSGGDGDLFGMELFYNTTASGLTGQNTAFNGNISATKWSDPDMSGAGTTSRGYTYSYDKLNRLTAANHFANTTSTNKFGVSGLTYDLNGNIKALKRRSTSTSAYMDNLTYAYAGNQLTKVDDSGDDGEGFTETTTGTDYAYDANGNMISDNNKGITAIDYNHLNLPVEVTMSGSGNRIEYLYDAAGIKLKQEVYESNTLTKTTDYVGEFIYEDGDLQLIQQEEGRVVPEWDIAETSIIGFDYQYHLKDHLGNARLTFSTTPESYEMEATMEDSNEANSFSNYLATPDGVAANSGTHVFRNTNTINEGVGMNTFLAINKGDTIKTSAYAYYNDGGSSYTLASGLIANKLFGSFGTNYGAEGATVAQSNFDDAFGGSEILGGRPSSPSEPQAFINYIFFDRDMNYEHAGFKQIPGTANGTSVKVTVDDFIADRDGYIMIYLSNETSTSSTLTVSWDDFEVYHGKTNIVQADDYYPFGLTFNSYSRTASTPQNFLNQGKEYIDELGTYDFHARMYDPVLGRTWQTDPKADKFFALSPYSWVANNPLSFSDPTGMEFDWSQLQGRDKRIAKRALRRHKSSGTYKNLYKQLKKSDNRYVVKADRSGGDLGNFYGNQSSELEGFDGETISIQTAQTEDDFGINEGGGIISLNFDINEGLSTKEQVENIGDVAVEEVIHAAQYDDANQGSNEAGLPATANTEFEAKAIVGKVKAESRRSLFTPKVDDIAHKYGLKGFDSGKISVTEYQRSLKQWRNDPRQSGSYSRMKIRDTRPKLLQRLIKK